MKSDALDAAHPPKPSWSGPLGCDTFVALPPATPPGIVLFGKNSDRPAGEGQSIRRYPAADHNVVTDDDDDSMTMVRCTYLSIPQVTHTHAVLLSQIDWMWGAEMGANERGVVIGNEAVWTVEPDVVTTPALLGMDLVRLGLERGDTAVEAVRVMTRLLETHGQGGACAHDDPTFTYHNSFLVADATTMTAIILETAGRHWVTRRVSQQDGTHNISNGLTIRTDFTGHSEGLHAHAVRRRLWNGEGRLDWAATFGEGGVKGLDAASPYSRLNRGRQLLQEGFGGRGCSASTNHCMTAQRVMDILRDHEGGICMHGPGFETTASMVSELHADDDDGTKSRHWMTGRPLPCQSPFVEQTIHGDADEGDADR